jgi:aerobic carbon-monoxide dehydrogenase small subunit
MLGASTGVCGACTILVDGRPARSCLRLAVKSDGCAVTSIEGINPSPGNLSILQDAFCETQALQCGYCTPGMILAGDALLAETLQPAWEELRRAAAISAAVRAMRKSSRRSH